MDSLDFEEQLVGSMMFKGDHIDCRDIAGKLPPEAFANAHLRRIYESVVALLNKAEPIDGFTVREGLPEETRDRVLDVASRCKSSANIKAWAKRVRQCWMLRKDERELTRAVSILRSSAAHDHDIAKRLNFDDTENSNCYTSLTFYIATNK